MEFDSAVRDAYINTRSSNSCQQLRRAKRQIAEQWGQLAIEHAADVQIAKDWLIQLGRLRKRRWHSENPHEGFNSARFKQFFDQLFDTGLIQGRTQILRLSAGRKSIC